MASRVQIISPGKLVALHTGTLLARLQKLWECEDSLKGSEREWDGEKEPDPVVTGLIEFKNTAVWKEAYQDLKAILQNREHLPRPEERRLKRLQRSKR